MDLAFCIVVTLGRQIVTSKQMPLAHGAVVHFFKKLLVSVGMARGMEFNRHNGKRTSSHSDKLRDMGPHIKRQHVLFQCDNNSLVSCISKGYSKNPPVMHLFRCLWYFVAFFDICIFCRTYCRGNKLCS